tara:strand:- start:212 stop:1003 length:792 start_codon:yes stop_codon:yes gene_type:complete
MCAILFSASFAGCLSGDEENEKSSAIDLIVYYETTSGTIEEVVEKNQQVSETGVDISFDFSYTKSSEGQIETYYFIPGDGSSAIENTADSGEITYTYLTHGLFDAAIGAIDDQGNENYENITIRIDKQITWTDTNTANPNMMNIETTPDCECDTPNQIRIDSTVTNNPNTFGIGGQSITITWRLLNSTDIIAAESPPEQVGDGQDANWLHNQNFIEAGTWKLEVEISADGDGNEQVNVDHLVSIVYTPDESEPNPIAANPDEA